ncbi:unnamed protein product [Closterium sp. NIES-64]|nr:unnamed protein product [Closterium sp. NIES-64]
MIFGKLDCDYNLLSSWSSWESTQTPFAEREGQEEHQSTRLSGTDVYFPSSGPSSAAVPSVLSRLGPLGSFRSPGASERGSIAPLRVWASLPPPKPLPSPSLPPKQLQPPSGSVAAAAAAVVASDAAKAKLSSSGVVLAGVRSGVTFNKHYSTANDVPLYDRSESGVVLGINYSSNSSRSAGVGAGSNETENDANAPSDTATEAATASAAAAAAGAAEATAAAAAAGGDLSSLTPLFLHSDSSLTEEALKLKSAARCFNCGSYTHALRDCQRPRDHAAVAAARAEHAGGKGQGGQGGKGGNSAAGEGGVGKSRYYGFGGAGGGKGRGGSMEERFEGLVPGVLSAELRAAMGIGVSGSRPSSVAQANEGTGVPSWFARCGHENATLYIPLCFLSSPPPLQDRDPPPWLRRMRELGYPPGYLGYQEEEKAEVKGQEPAAGAEKASKEEGEDTDSEAGEIPAETNAEGKPVNEKAAAAAAAAAVEDSNEFKSLALVLDDASEEGSLDADGGGDGEGGRGTTPEPEPFLVPTVEFPGLNAPPPEGADEYAWGGRGWRADWEESERRRRLRYEDERWEEERRRRREREERERGKEGRKDEDERERKRRRMARDGSADEKREGGKNDREGRSGRDRNGEKDREGDRDRRRDRSKERGRDRSRERGRDRSRERGKDRSRERGRDRSRERGRDRSRERRQERSRERRRETSKERGRDRSKERGRDRSRDRNRDRSKERSKDWSRERNRDRSSDRKRDADEKRREEWSPIRHEDDRGAYEGRERSRAGDTDSDRWQLDRDRWHVGSSSSYGAYLDQSRYDTSSRRHDDSANDRYGGACGAATSPPSAFLSAFEAAPPRGEGIVGVVKDARGVVGASASSAVLSWAAGIESECGDDGGGDVQLDTYQDYNQGL